MIHIARTWRVFAGGMAAGFVGVMIIAGGRASADPGFPLPPLPPVPTPSPAQMVAPPVQNLTAVPGGVNTNRFAPAPAQAPAPAPATSPLAPTGIATAPAAAPMPPTMTPAITGTLRDYLHAKGVKLEAQRPQGFKALDITLPMPPRWTHVPDPNVPDAFAVIADRVGGTSIYTSNAQVVVYKLVGDFDPAEAITHGYVDSQQLLAWQTTNASMANLGSFPSSVIEGTYRENDMTLNTSRRHVIASSGPDKYLVSLSVTTAASQAVADAPATDAIINGFGVAAPAAGARSPARVTAPTAPAQLPATPSHPAPLALPGQQPVTNLGPVPSLAPAPPPLTTVAPVPGR
ncbi:LpqN/LpqT family lipoprotein [Mycobacterium riyadhense]|uniref:LpqN/LpqT family lipoprotein n=1 Tax=Mycobacterium riyadhense TaxID=486698 RepID=UPI00195B0489|nr:LpqN/LpqT family lipoprotein [Mycobacterium riyadhense]